MKKSLLVALILALAVTGTAFADSLAVNAGAAMGGTNFGLEVDHDNSSTAYVQDNTPVGEKVYRAEFLYSLAAVNTEPSVGLRQPVFVAIGNNPNPGVGLCSPVNAFVESIRLFQGYTFFGSPPVGRDWLQARSRGNLCGEFSTGAVFFRHLIDTNGNGDVRVCMEWESNPGTNGGAISLAVIDDTDACSGATYQTTAGTNSDVTVEFVRLGTPQTNAIGAGEDWTYNFDEFASFRTLGP